MNTETKTPKYVNGYWRNKEDEAPKKDGGEVLAAVMVLAVVGELAIVFWRVTLTLAALSIAGYGLYKYLKWHNDPSRLRINYLGGEAWYKRPLGSVIGAGYPYQKLTLTALLAVLGLSISR